jgi:hypothetical protein
MLSAVNVFFFQNCAQHASIALQADLQSLSSKITSKNTFFVYKNSLGEKFSPILQSDSPEFEAIKNNPSYSFNLQNDTALPLELQNGTVTEVSDSSFFFIPKKDFEELFKAGVAAIFGPGTSIPAAVKELLELIIAKRFSNGD